MSKQDLSEIMSSKEADLRALTAYYKSFPVMWHGSDYQELLCRIRDLEKKTGVMMADSPSRHNPPESVDKLQSIRLYGAGDRIRSTSSIEDVVAFAGQHRLLLNRELDGQPVTLYYQEGNLQRAVIHKPNSTTGYEVTHIAKQMKWVPVHIPARDPTQVQGTAVISWKTYNRLTCNNENKFHHPAVLARRCMRSGDGSNGKIFRLEFIAHHISQQNYVSKKNILNTLKTYGFEVVDHRQVIDGTDARKIRNLQRRYTPYNSKYPVRGLIFEFDDVGYHYPDTEDIQKEEHAIKLVWPYDLYEIETIGTLRLLNDIDLDHSRTQ